MKKVVNSILVLTIVIILSCNALVGCSKKESVQSNNADKKTTDSTKKVEELSFDVLCPHFGVDPSDSVIQNEWLKVMEKHMDMKLNIKWERIPWGDYREKVNLVLASGDYPDVFLSVDEKMKNKYGNEGMLLNVSEYMEYAPNYKDFIDNTPDADIVLYTGEGNSYGFSDGFMNPNNIESTQYAWAYRFDVFEKHNIKIPETLDELYEAAKKLKELYPDSYPINQNESYLKPYEEFMWVNHTSQGIYWNGNEFVYGPTEEAYKEALMFANKLYKEELLDPEFFIDTFDQSKEKALNNRTFIYPAIWAGYVNQFNLNKEFNGQWGLSMPANNPKYGTAWKRWSQVKGKLLRKGSDIVISAKAKNPELLVKLIDYQYSDENIELLNWGIEGTTFKRNEDGSKAFMPEITNADDPIGKLAEFGISSSMRSRSGIVFTPQDFDSQIAQWTEDPWYHNGEFIEEKFWLATEKFGGKESIAPNDRAPKYNTTKDEKDTITNTMTPVETYESECAVKFVIGEMSFDQWDEFQDNLKKMGDYESILKMYNDKVKK